MISREKVEKYYQDLAKNGRADEYPGGVPVFHLGEWDKATFDLHRVAQIWILKSGRVFYLHHAAIAEK